MGEDVDFCVVPVNPLPVVPNLFGLLDAHRQSPLEEPDSRASIGRGTHEDRCVNRAFLLLLGQAAANLDCNKCPASTRRPGLGGNLTQGVERGTRSAEPIPVLASPGAEQKESNYGRPS